MARVTTFRALLCYLIGLMALLCVPTASAAGASNEATLTVKQTIGGGPTGSDDSFSYRLTGSAGAPMPTGSDGSGYTFSLTGDTQTGIVIDLTAPPGTYDYTLACTTGTKPGYTPDTHTYTIRVYVLANQTHTLVVKDQNGDKTNGMAYHHTWTGSSNSPTNPTETASPTETVNPTGSVKPTGTVAPTGTVRPTGSVAPTGSVGPTATTDPDRLAFTGFDDWRIVSLALALVATGLAILIARRRKSTTFGR
jgi:hypothetical protein